MTISYGDLTSRNMGYIAPEVQARIRGTSLLVAGCGLGSAFAEVAVRTGFERFTLVDGDRVEAHNLNRQAFQSSDIATKKVQALAEHLRAINPSVHVRPIDGWVTSSTARELVARSDFILDTIDFLDLAAIVALHDECHSQRKPILSLLSLGWSACAVYFPIEASCTLRQILELPAKGSIENASYVRHFTRIVDRLASALPPEVVAVTRSTLASMEDGRTCPAPQLGVGATAAASLAVTVVVRVLAGLPVTSAPSLITANLWSLATDTGLDITP